MIENYFEFPSDIEEIINKEYKVTQKEVLQMVEMVLDWIKKQPHLPLEPDFMDSKIKFMIRCNKMSIEKTKQKIDMHYTYKNILPEFFADREPKNKNIQNIMDVIAFVPLKAAMGTTRVFIAKLIVSNIERWNILDYYRIVVNTFDLRIRYDLCPHEVAVIDLQRLTLAHAMTVTPTLIAKGVKLFEKTYSDRLFKIHFLNCPPFWKSVVQMVKSVLKEKVANRLYIHESLDTLYDHVPRHILPKDYGGNNKSLDEINAEWRIFVEGQHEWIKEINKLKSNEMLRPGKPIVDDIMGVEGSFRKLDLD